MKKSIFCLFVFTVFSHVLLAQDCGDLHNNETVRIDQPGGSLENFRVQDQDGVGTCYANAASLLLQSKIEGHPEVSYLHLASMYKSEKLEKDKAEAKISGNYDVYAKAEIDPHKAVVPGADSMKWSLGIDGGFSCEVIDNAIKVQKNKKAIVDVGAPLGDTKLVNENGISNIKNLLCAYAVVKAKSHAEAAKLFFDHPHFSIFPGDSVEVMECLPIPEM